jgi:stage V sporulation protein R
MMDDMANHATRIRRHMDRHGVDAVENFIDVALSLENLIDPHAPFIVRERAEAAADAPRPVAQRLKSKSYMNDFINPPHLLEAEQRRLEEEAASKRGRFPASPARDILRFLIEHARLENWQRDVLAIVRDEAYYFAPQAQTKIMNEGWATYWHSKIMTERALADSELIDYADHHSGTLGGRGRINPYKLGVELYRDIEDRWNRGRFGKDYDDCDDLQARARWDRKVGLGREKIFEVRRVCTDITFIDGYLTEEFCHAQKLFLYDYNPKTGMYQISDREFGKVKQRLLAQLTNQGQPIIEVVDGNHRNRGELLLQHRYDGVELRHDYARETLRNVLKVWGRPVALQTVMDDKRRTIAFDGEEFEEKDSADKVA